jgi:thiol:disulfide interchange protein
LKADLTRSDAPGWPLLKKLNPSGGIPLTAIYPPGSSEPIQLASIYTADDLVRALEQADRPATAAR